MCAPTARRRQSPERPALASGTARPHACAQRKWTVHASPACPELEPIEVFFKLSDALCGRTTSENIVRGPPEVARQAIVMGTDDTRRPSRRIAQGLQQVTEKRIGCQHLRVMIESRNSRVIRADDG